MDLATDYDADIDYDAVLDYDGIYQAVGAGSQAGSEHRKRKKRKKSRSKVYYAPSHIAEITRRYNESIAGADKEQVAKLDAAVQDFIEVDGKIDFQSIVYEENIVALINSIYDQSLAIAQENLSLNELQAQSMIEQRLAEQKILMHKMQEEEDDELLFIIGAACDF